MVDKQAAAILIINDVPVSHTLQHGCAAGEPIMRMLDELIQIAEGKLVCRNHIFGKETGEEEIFCSSEDCYGYISDHEGLYGLSTDISTIQTDGLLKQTFCIPNHMRNNIQSSETLLINIVLSTI